LIFYYYQEAQIKKRSRVKWVKSEESELEDAIGQKGIEFKRRLLKQIRDTKRSS